MKDPDIVKKGPIIAIDGPAGTGKSSVTKRLAELLDFVYVDTGALYRAVAYFLSKDSDSSILLNEAEAESLARSLQFEFRRLPKKNPSNRIFVNHKDITNFIRTPEVSMAASSVSAFPGVRSALLGLQRKLGGVGNCILEGRDIGTVVFPHADVKFFLTADLDERVKRRLIELEASGADTPSYEELKKQMIARDHQDKTRQIAPLKKAEDALEIDTTELTLDEVVESLRQVILRKTQ